MKFSDSTVVNAWELINSISLQKYWSWGSTAICFPHIISKF